MDDEHIEILPKELIEHIQDKFIRFGSLFVYVPKAHFNSAGVEFGFHIIKKGALESLTLGLIRVNELTGMCTIAKTLYEGVITNEDEDAILRTIYL